MVLREKRRIYDLWKKGQKTQDCRGVKRLWEETIRRAKAQRAFNLVSTLKDNEKYSYKYICKKTRTKENAHPILDVEGNAVTKAEENTEVLNSIFASVFNNKMVVPCGCLGKFLY